MRWWDGSRWTDHTQSAPWGSPGPATATAAATATPAPHGGSSLSGSSLSGFRPTPSFAKLNERSLIAIGFAALYVVVALAANVVFLGVVPALSAVRAIQRKEPLAPVAGIAAGLAIVMAVVLLGR